MENKERFIMWHWMRFRCYHDNLTPLHIIIYHHKNVSCLYNEIPANVCAMAFPWDKICYLGLIEGYNYSTNLQSHSFPHSVNVFRHVNCSKLNLSYFSDWKKKIISNLLQQFINWRSRRYVGNHWKFVPSRWECNVS